MKDSGKRVYVVGSRSLQNDLLTCHIGDKSGIRCCLAEHINKLPKDGADPAAEKKLILYDCLGMDRETLLRELASLPEISQAQFLLAIFNIQPGCQIEEEVMGFGVRGFFYVNDSAACMVKGVDAIFAGEHWIPRKVMVKCLSQANWSSPKIKKTPSPLTNREEEILGYVAIGATNEVIGNNLCISPHTVRTHIYNIFKKINVPNRLQASLWAAKNL